MVAVTATLVGSMSPQAVQVAVSGLAPGDAYLVTGQWSGGSWTVRGGDGVSDGTLLVLADIAAPINVPLTYQVTVAGATVSSSPVTVAFGEKFVLQSVDGRLSASFVWMANDLPRSMGMRSAVFDIPGRADPVVLYDVPTTDTAEIVVMTNPAQTRALRDLLSLGGLALLRTDGGIFDQPAVSYVLVTSVSSQLVGVGGDRRWTLGYRLIGDPEPGAIVAASTWDDVTDAYAGFTWDDVTAEWAGQTWDDFATYDWASRA